MCRHRTTVTVTFCIAEEEFLSIAEKLKPFTEEKMKIEPFPWYEGYLINMDELYTELTLEKVERQLLGEETWSLRTYEDMFNCNKSEHNNRKILIKADPGMGKTTLGRKVARDWAIGKFKKFSIILFVALKFVKPGDPIENIIMQQIPELEGLKISQQKLKVLLDRFSKRILIILDGVDEHRLGQNDDVIKIIKNQKLLDCRIVVSSRPHSVKEVEQHFPTIIRVEGFKRRQAKMFVSSFFGDQNIITQILQFKPSDSRENFPVHKCPILLSFLCLLVKEKKIDLLDKKLTVGDLYLRMVQCLYKKFTNRKGIGFVESVFVQVMKSVGIIALRTLLSKNPLLQKSEVLGIVGEFAFEYGFFAGHEDFKLCTDPTADISVTYAHRSLEEFFGSFGFLQDLDDGKSVDEILGSYCGKPIFMVNPLVMKFCLWLLTTTEFFSSRRIVYDKLAAYAAQRIDYRMLNTKIVADIYPAMDIGEAVSDRDTLKLEFFKHVFEKCEQIRVMHAGTDEVKGIMELISHSLLSKLSLLAIGKHFLPGSVPDVNSSALTVSIECRDSVSCELISKTLQTNSDVLKRDPLVYARVDSEHSQDLKTLVEKHIKKLHVSNSDFTRSHPKVTLSVSGEFPFCPHLAHFTAQNYQISNSVPAAFLKAVKEGKFPSLRRIELKSCTMNDCEWPEVPEFSCDLRGLTVSEASQMQKLLLKLTELSDCIVSHEFDRLIPVRLENLSVLKLFFGGTTKLQRLNDVLKQGYVPNISELTLNGIPIEVGTFFREFDPNCTAKLEKLALHGFIISAEELEILGEKLSSIRLTELCLTSSSYLTGSLSALFTHSFPTLNTLILGWCHLNANDLQSLARANVEGKLPQLRHLDISKNEDVIISDLFTHSFPRLNTLILSWCKLNANDLQSLARANVDGKLPQLRHLDISKNEDVIISDLFTHSAQWNQLKTLETYDVNVLNIEPEFLTSLEELGVSRLHEQNPSLPDVTRCWSGLKTIVLDDAIPVPYYIADGVERGMFPDLKIVRRCYAYDYIVSALPLFKLFKANIVVI